MINNSWGFTSAGWVIRNKMIYDLFWAVVAVQWLAFLELNKL